MVIIIDMVNVMTTIQVSQETHTELNKIKGTMLAKNGKQRSFDKIINELIAVWKETKKQEKQGSKIKSFT